MAHEQTKPFRGTNYVITAAHPAAASYPWMPDGELQALADDIAANGQHDPVELLPDGRVLDGRNRELACRIAGVVPQYLTREDEWTEDKIYAWVNGKNDKRRHLTAGQRAMIAAEQVTARRGDNQHGKQGVEVPSREGTSVTTATAAGQLDVSVASVERAKKVKDKAPELTDAVKSGDLDVKTAAKVADLPKKERKKVAKAADPKKAAKKALEDAAPKLAEGTGPEPEGEDPENPEPDPAFMPHALEAEAFAGQFRNWVARLRAVRAEVRKALPDRGHVVARRIESGQFDAMLGELIETLDRNVPDRVCPVCVGTGAADEAACKFCDGFGIVDAHHHAGLKAKWKHTYARFRELKGAA